MNENQSHALTLFDLNQKIRRSQIKAAVAMAFIMGINLTVARYLNYKENDASWTEYLLHFSYGLWASAIIWWFNIYLNNPRFFRLPYAKTHPQQIFALKCALSIGFGIVMMAIWSEILFNFLSIIEDPPTYLNCINTEDLPLMSLCFCYYTESNNFLEVSKHWWKMKH